MQRVVHYKPAHLVGTRFKSKATRLVHLHAPARGGAAAWDALFFVAYLWHPGYKLGAITNGDAVTRGSGYEWWEASILPEYVMTVALPELLSGLRVDPIIGGPLTSGIGVVGAARLAAQHSEVDVVGQSILVAQWKSVIGRLSGACSISCGGVYSTKPARPSFCVRAPLCTCVVGFLRLCSPRLPFLKSDDCLAGARWVAAVETSRTRSPLGQRPPRRPSC